MTVSPTATGHLELLELGGRALHVDERLLPARKRHRRRPIHRQAGNRLFPRAVFRPPIMLHLVYHQLFLRAVFRPPAMLHLVYHQLFLRTVFRPPVMLHLFSPDPWST